MVQGPCSLWKVCQGWRDRKGLLTIVNIRLFYVSQTRVNVVRFFLFYARESRPVVHDKRKACSSFAGRRLPYRKSTMVCRTLDAQAGCREKFAGRSHAGRATETSADDDRWRPELTGASWGDFSALGDGCRPRYP